MTPEDRSTKQFWRTRLREENRRHPAAERHESSLRLCERITQNPLWQRSKCVLLFAPLPDEPDLSPLLASALAAGKRVALPRHLPAADTYEAALIRDVAADLSAGNFGVLEPSAACPVLPLMQLDLLLVPGIVFDVLGRRLGRGKGYYDRLLSQTPSAKCGVAFDWQLVEQLPAAPHDVPMNHLATPARWLTCEMPTHDLT